MVVNFRARGISRGTPKLAWTPMLIKKLKIEGLFLNFIGAGMEIKKERKNKGKKVVVTKTDSR
jgi:hypothetical protein